MVWVRRGKVIIIQLVGLMISLIIIFVLRMLVINIGKVMADRLANYMFLIQSSGFQSLVWPNLGIFEITVQVCRPLKDTSIPCAAWVITLCTLNMTLKRIQNPQKLTRYPRLPVILERGCSNINSYLEPL